ncbi:MAG: hypothetical protein ACOCP8_02775 [archaeon]
MKDKQIIKEMIVSIFNNIELDKNQFNVHYIIKKVYNNGYTMLKNQNKHFDSIQKAKSFIKNCNHHNNVKII